MLSDPGLFCAFKKTNDKQAYDSHCISVNYSIQFTGKDGKPVKQREDTRDDYNVSRLITYSDVIK